MEIFKPYKTTILNQPQLRMDYFIQQKRGIHIENQPPQGE